MKIAKLCINTWAYASRDKRELAACQELGAEVEVFAKGEHTGTEEVVDGFFRGKRWYTGSVTAEEFRDNDDRFNDYEVANKEAILQAFQILYGMEKNKGMNDE